MSSTGVRTQNPRDYTVQIRRIEDNTIVGTGVVVSAKGLVATCAHVYKEATGLHPRDANDELVGVYFPQVGGAETKERTATVEACFPSHDDDMVLLQLTDGPAPLGPEKIAVVGMAKPSQGNEFRAYGYRRLDKYLAGWADGAISGCVERPEDGEYLTEPVQLESSQINHGMSGSGVLDTERNLVIGIVSEVFFPESDMKDRDTAWAVDSQVLTFAPLLFALQEEDEPLKDAPAPKTDVEAAKALLAPTTKSKLVNAPPPLEEWVGRVELLDQITADWVDEDTCITGLIGFGGEGKSSLARRWLTNLRDDKKQPQPDGIFWWGFYEKPSVDEFFEAALEYMGGGKIDPTKLQSASMRAQVIGAMLGNGRYLFVLDGLEVMQHQKGDKYGLFKSRDLRDFLRYFGRSRHNSFCLITSRAPILDMMSYTTHQQRDVARLSEADGCALLRELGVEGHDDALKKVVSDWDGHALTLGLIGSLVGERYDGDLAKAGIDKIEELPEPEEGQERYKGVYSHVHRILRRYDEHLTEAEQAFMTMFSAFRLPVKSESFGTVFRTQTGATSINVPVAKLDGAAFDAMIQRLVQYRILRFDSIEKHYTAHPLVRKHYVAILTKKDQGQQTDAHQQIKDYYLEIAEQPPEFPTLEDLAPWIEIVHHLCQAGAYDEAHEVRRDRIAQANSKVLIHKLGAYDIALEILLQFFPDGDLTQSPQVSDPKDKSWIFNSAGYYLMSLGRLREAVPFFERGNEMRIQQKDWKNASIGYQNLSDIRARLGLLAESVKAAEDALDLAQRAKDTTEERDTLVYLGWSLHLSGKSEASSDALAHAENLEQGFRYLYNGQGVRHAEHLLRINKRDYARRISQSNLSICKDARWIEDISRCHRVLGDTDADDSRHDEAGKHYEEALKTARSITRRDVLIEALLARGRWWAKHMKKPDEAFSDLNEALELAVDGEYRIYEADIRIALGWAHFCKGDMDAARAEVDRAMQMSKDMGYHWGKVDGQELLSAMNP